MKTRILFTAIVFLAMCVQSALSQFNNFTLASIFADNMVLQQQTKAQVWGTGTVGAIVTITPSWGKKAIATVSPHGKWSVKIQTPKAGGPYEIRIQHNDSILVLKNILIGEVWLASGQSNMEMPLQGWPPRDTIINSTHEIANAHFPSIRMFTVQRNFSTSPLHTLKGAWEVCLPASAPRFSATAFFFAKKLHKELQVPIGIIHSSWGGTPIEAWMSSETLSQFGEFKETLKKIEENKGNEMKLNDWLNTFPTIDMSARTGDDKWANVDFNDRECANPQYPDTNWKEMTLPTLWERTELGDIDGVVWFRKTIDIPSSWVRKKIQLKVGMIDDVDATFVNGVKVGGYEKEGFWSTHRNYTIPDSLVQGTKITIAVRVIDFQGGGGIYGDKNLLCMQLEGTNEIISLADNWKYLPVAIYRNTTMHVLGTDVNAISTKPTFIIQPSAYIPTTLFNAMIHPLVPFAVRGAIWYQGESNTGRHEQYKKLFPAMIEEWRKKFQVPDFPFYYVQIAPWRYGKGTHSEFLREAQLQTLSTKNTGMAVTLDIGDINNIHPANKHDVGNRLALWALAKTYGKKLIPSGPLYTSSKVKNGSFMLNFSYAGKGLKIIPNNGSNEFTIAGEDSVFKAAQVEVTGASVRVFHPEIQKPLAVRYAFSDTSTATLFNSEDLPASSFRTDAWKK